MTAPHRRTLPLPTAAILSATPAFATTFTWFGASCNTADPTNWSNNADPTGLNTDQLLFPTNTPAYSNITFDSALESTPGFFIHF